MCWCFVVFALNPHILCTLIERGYEVYTPINGIQIDHPNIPSYQPLYICFVNIKQLDVKGGKRWFAY